MTTFPRNTVTGAPQNCRQRVGRKAARGSRRPCVLRVSAGSPGLLRKGGHSREAGPGAPGRRCPPGPPPTHPPGPHPPPGPPSRLFSVSRLSSSRRSSRPVRCGASSLQAQGTLRATRGASCQPAREFGVHGEGMRGGGTWDPHGCWTKSPAPRGSAAHTPEGDEAREEQARAEEGAQQPQDRRARSHVPPPDLGQEGLEERRAAGPSPPLPVLRPVPGTPFPPSCSPALPPGLHPGGQGPSVLCGGRLGAGGTS